MKIIDLLNKIANGEDVPERIMYDNHIFDHNDGGKANYYCTELGKLLEELYVFEELNNEVEILDEKEKIEKIDMFDYFTGYWCKELPKDFLQHLENNFGTLNSIINELIDEVNKLKESDK